MSKERECPKCGAWMEYEGPEPDVGIDGGWYCHECGHTEREDYDESDLMPPETTAKGFEEYRNRLGHALGWDVIHEWEKDIIK